MRTESGWVGVYKARNGRWQAQVNHRAIGGYATAREAGIAVAELMHDQDMKSNHDSAGPELVLPPKKRARC